MTDGYALRRASAEDIPIMVHHREAMFREMGREGDYDAMRPAFAEWVREHLATGRYRPWLVTAGDGEVVGGGGSLSFTAPPART